MRNAHSSGCAGLPSCTLAPLPHDMIHQALHWINLAPASGVPVAMQGCLDGEWHPHPACRCILLTPFAIAGTFSAMLRQD